MKNFRSHIATAILIAAAAGPLPVAVAQSQPGRFFGYYANNGYIAENANHTNVTFVFAGYTSQTVATDVILQELNQAKLHGVKAVVEVSAFLLSSNGECSYSMQPNAAAYWSTFVSRLIAAGHLNPQNPAGNTVAAFYPVDEPDACGLSDINGTAHPALVNAINTIRNKPETANIPIAVIASSRYASAIKGLRLFNWVGLDDYSVSTSAYLSMFGTLQNQLSASQRTILVPQAAWGGFMDNTTHEPEPIYGRFNTDSKVIGIVPFLWGNPDTNGVRTNVTLSTTYTSIGKHIAKGGPPPLLVSSSCASTGTGMALCSASATGGTPPYTYSWQGGMPNNAAFARYFSPCSNRMAHLTVKDATGQPAYKQHALTC